MPRVGRVSIFDRSWYGRVLVERVEGFCAEADWLRAYTEINDFEHELAGAGAVIVNVIVLLGQADVMFTAYVPLKAHPLFYLGIILVAVGTLTGVFNFFATLYVAKRDGAYEGSMPLVTFGALAAAIIAQGLDVSFARIDTARQIAFDTFHLAPAAHQPAPTDDDVARLRQALTDAAR